MSSAPVSPHGFVALRGRGYRPGQVDAFTSDLWRERDAAWERAARLTVLAKQMEAETARLREVVAGLAPQSYEALGDRARDLFALVEAEAEAVREGARADGRRLMETADEHARGVREAALAHADAVRAEAEERARQRLLAARAEADEYRVAIRRGVKEGRSEVLCVLRETRQRAAATLADQAADHAGLWAREDEAERAREADAAAREAEREARAEAALSDAQRALAETEQSARRCQEEARARAAEIVADARIRADRIARDTERVLREHGERWDDVQAQMDCVRSSLTALTGSAPAE
ncbi:cellulose-binding protein [Streptomyces sp. NPDC101249]|uniref:cellulose-binding protein n=1 Tax=Streptomyces sp. NPDC101249 TaxID=3366140 RepID=UPI00382DC9E3